MCVCWFALSPFGLCVCARGSKLDTVEVLCFRDRTMQGSRSIQHSVVLQIKLPKHPLNSGNFRSFMCGHVRPHNGAWHLPVLVCVMAASVCAHVLVVLSGSVHIYCNWAVNASTDHFCFLFMPKLISHSSFISPSVCWIRGESHLNGNSRMVMGVMVLMSFVYSVNLCMHKLTEFMQLKWC